MPSDVPVSSIFIDESGSKNSAGGFFVLGFIKARQTAALDRSIRHLRQRFKFFDEIKFGAIRQDSERFYIELVELVAASDVRLGGSVYDASTSLFVGQETWRTQALMSSRLIAANINKGEIVNAFLDLVQTPHGETLAAKVAADVNRKLEARCLVGCYELDSRACNMLQVADVIAGSIAYERRQWTGDTPDAPREARTPKARVAGRLRRALQIDSFADTRSGKVNILTMRH